MTAVSAQALPLKTKFRAATSMGAGSVVGFGAPSFGAGLGSSSAALLAEPPTTVRTQHSADLALATSPEAAVTTSVAPSDAEIVAPDAGSADSPPAAIHFLIACMAIVGFLAMRSRVRPS